MAHILPISGHIVCILDRKGRTLLDCSLAANASKEAGRQEEDAGALHDVGTAMVGGQEPREECGLLAGAPQRYLSSAIDVHGAPSFLVNVCVRYAMSCRTAGQLGLQYQIDSGPARSVTHRNIVQSIH